MGKTQAQGLGAATEKSNLVQNNHQKQLIHTLLYESSKEKSEKQKKARGKKQERSAVNRGTTDKSSQTG